MYSANCELVLTYISSANQSKYACYITFTIINPTQHILQYLDNNIMTVVARTYFNLLVDSVHK